MKLYYIDTLVLATLLFLLLRLIHYLWFQRRVGRPSRSVAILVLGDVGRSPRMMYHAQSFVKEQFETYIVGYSGSQPFPSLLASPLVHFVFLDQPPAFISKLPPQLFILLAPLKVLHQTMTILFTLLVRISHPPHYIIVQNPPTIPALALVWLVARLRGSRVIIDWHNLGYSILAMRLGRHHPLVAIATKFEQVFGRNAYAHLFVTKAMHNYLVKEWNLKGITAILHDRPPSHFSKSSPTQIHDLFLTLAPDLVSSGLTTFLPLASNSAATTAFTTLDQSPSIYSGARTAALRPDRPALLVSSTSWTADENFEILIKALSLYEHRAQKLNAGSKGLILPKVLMLVTGKGPLRDLYMTEISALEAKENWRWVRCRSLWLAAEQYPVLLGSADLGISLHSSSSGLDLPMKVVDMFGCQLPVCALDFDCLHELVKEGENGLIFNTAEELAECLERLLHSYPRSDLLHTLHANLERDRPKQVGPQPPIGQEGGWSTWEDNWNRVVKPVLYLKAD